MDSVRRGLVQRSGREDGVGDSERTPGRRWWPVAILSAVWLIASAGCVRTAECNESTRCPEGEVCFRYECRQRCEEDAECEADDECVPCEEPESGDNRCFGETVRACVPGDFLDGG